MRTIVNQRTKFIATAALLSGLVSCVSDPTLTAPREIVTQIPQANPTVIHFEYENLPSSAYPTLTGEENALPSSQGILIWNKKYAERVARERGWCPNGVKAPKAVTGFVGAGRRITKFSVECEQY